MVRELLESVPLWETLLITVALVLVSNELGFRLGAYHRGTQEKDDHSQVVSMTGAHLGLLAFILAFSFSMSAGHFGDRKQFLLEEVNAIETAFLRAGLVTEPEGGNISSLLADYTATRAMIGPPDTIAQIIKESEAIQTDIWAEIVQLSEKEKLTVMDSLLVQAVNIVFDLHEKRVYAGLHNRIPPNIWVALYVILILSMIGMGFSSGMSGKRSVVASSALALSFSMVMYVIADLDRPTSGLMKTDQTIMVNLAQRLQKAR
jgi:hypothetical protein